MYAADEMEPLLDRDLRVLAVVLRAGQAIELLIAHLVADLVDFLRDANRAVVRNRQALEPRLQALRRALVLAEGELFAVATLVWLDELRRRSVAHRVLVLPLVAVAGRLALGLVLVDVVDAVIEVGRLLLRRLDVGGELRDLRNGALLRHVGGLFDDRRRRLDDGRFDGGFGLFGRGASMGPSKLLRPS